MSYVNINIRPILEILQRFCSDVLDGWRKAIESRENRQVNFFNVYLKIYFLSGKIKYMSNAKKLYLKKILLINTIFEIYILTCLLYPFFSSASSPCHLILLKLIQRKKIITVGKAQPKRSKAVTVVQTPVLDG